MPAVLTNKAPNQILPFLGTAALPAGDTKLPAKAWPDVKVIATKLFRLPAVARMVLELVVEAPHKATAALVPPWAGVI